MNPTFASGVAAVAIAIGIIAFVLMTPSRRVPLQRMNPDAPPPEGTITRAAGALTGVVGRSLERRGALDVSQALDEAGLKVVPQDYLALNFIGSFVAGLVGYLIGNLFGMVVLALAVPLVATLVLSVKTERRRKAFADQLDDILQLMASSLRAGHSLPQSLDAISKEAERPASEEFARVTNEARVGRDLTVALSETAQRMRSEDFLWVTQAIAINRQAGGNLAEVLDGVAHTIRERNEIRRQVETLSAEGKLSAAILLVLPVFVVGFILLTNPNYFADVVGTTFGWIMLAMVLLLYLVGGLWMRQTIKIRF